MLTLVPTREIGRVPYPVVDRDRHMDPHVSMVTGKMSWPFSVSVTIVTTDGVSLPGSGPAPCNGSLRVGRYLIVLPSRAEQVLCRWLAAYL